MSVLFKKILVFAFLTLTLLGVSWYYFKTPNKYPCGKYKTHRLYKGEEGGCYYKNKSGEKFYVDRELCDC